MTAKSKRKNLFVLIIPRFEDIFHSFYAGEIVKGVNLAASRLNVDIFVHITDRFNRKNWLDPTFLDRKKVDGILFADIDGDINAVKYAIKKGMPTLTLNNMLDEPINCIAIDNYRAAYEAVEKLIKMGHKRIATITGDLAIQAASLRLQGYEDAMKKHGLDVPKPYIKNGSFLRTPARKAASQLLQLKERPTAIFAASDVMALEVIDVAKKAKFSVPSRLSVVGFDDNPINVYSSISLATVSQPLVEMGRLGLEHLYQVRYGKAKLPIKILLPAEFKSGQSIKKV